METILSPSSKYLLHFINIFNLLKSVAKMLKLSQFMAQLHCNTRPDIADCLWFLRRFPVTFLIPIRNLFSSEYLNRNRVLSLHLDLKLTASLLCGKSLSIVLLNLVLKLSETFPKYGKTKFKFLFRTMKLKSILINNLFKNFF